MPLPKQADPFATWWVLKSRDPASLLHGIMFMKKLEGELSQKHKTSIVAEEQLIADLLKSEALINLGQAWSENHPPKRARTTPSLVAEVGGRGLPPPAFSQSSSSSSFPTISAPATFSAVSSAPSGTLSLHFLRVNIRINPSLSR